MVPSPSLVVAQQYSTGDVVLCLQALQQQMSELETKLVQARTDSKAQVKGHNSGKKELEAHSLPLPSNSRAQCSWHLCFSSACAGNGLALSISHVFT